MVDEQLKMIIDQFNRINQNLEKMNEQIDRKFEQMEQRFEQIDRKFEQMEQRFEQIDRKFEQIEQRFEQIDRKFEQIERRFEQIDKKFEQIEQKFKDINIYIFDLFKGIDEHLAEKIETTEKSCKSLNQKYNAVEKSDLANKEMVDNHEYRIRRLEEKMLKNFVAEDVEKYE